jgi:hypothetical protein
MTAGRAGLRRVGRVDLSSWSLVFKAVMQGSIGKPLLSSTTAEIQVFYNENVTRIGFD